ncbi:hypothetical protein BPOR_0470g00060 [Botrytis porri]|uniref:Uncharacterized protein n=1 Tax=Botrytis porri TaxID=87229 RepID=A0A4Z1KRN9_9HELO|nr:hypothetical protein BPOR_0470g00060 [Botrytis porri]
MPPKRKAASSNSSSKVAKAAANATPASSTDIAGGDVNFSNANTIISCNAAVKTQTLNPT